MVNIQAGERLIPSLMTGVGNGHAGTYCQGMTITDRAEYSLFRFLSVVLGLLPCRLAEGVLTMVARLAVRRGWWRAELARRQLAEAFPDLPAGDLHALVMGLYDHLALTVAEVFIPGWFLPRIRVPGGWEVFDRALGQGKGLILASLHLGNFELCGRVIAARCELLDVVKPQRNPLFDRHLDRMRNECGIATVPMDRSGPAVLRHLRRGGVVSLLLDQDAGDKGIMVEFMGRPASTWPGAARLSLQTGCPVLPVCLARTSDGGHELEFGPLLDPRQLPAGQREATAYTQLITAELEAFVRRHPEQWFWVHRRWKGAG